MNKIAFIGAGNMNGAIISGLVKKGYTPQDIMVVAPSEGKRKALSDSLNILHSASNIEAAKFADYIVLGVKPHIISSVCEEIQAQVDISQKCFISVAAGCPVAQMQNALVKPTSIIRTMPNTPSQLGLGATGMFASELVTAEQKEVAQTLMAAVGITKWVDEEKNMDVITSISGSGPAYFFLFMEAMQNKAKALGFSEQDSRELVQQTALGAAQMVIQNDLPISQLRENVTSKGGTTQAALNSFVASDLTEIVDKAMQCAIDRAQEMARDNA